MDERKKVRHFANGDISPGFYIYADNQLFLYSGRSHTRDMYTVYIGKIPGQYLVTDGELWAHCKSFRAGVEDIRFKRASSRGADQYKGLNLDEPRTVEDMKTMYRVITGACRAGTDAFVDSVRDLKDTYTIREVLELTKGQYNSTVFQKFFEAGEDSDTST